MKIVSLKPTNFDQSEVKPVIVSFSSTMKTIVFLILTMILFGACRKINSLPVNNADCGCRELTNRIDIAHCLDTCSYWQTKAKHSEDKRAD